MKEKDIHIALLQDTKGKHNSRESRKEFTWYFSSENPTNTGYTTGTAIVIKNSMAKHVREIVPINDRLMYMVLEHSTPITIINAYIPQAGRPTEEKKGVYAEIDVVAMYCSCLTTT